MVQLGMGLEIIFKLVSSDVLLTFHTRLVFGLEFSDKAIHLRIPKDIDLV